MLNEDKYKIIWEKFEFPNNEIDEKDEIEDFDNYKEYDDEPKINIGQLISEPMPTNPFVRPKTFNFWCFHTNFKITAKLAEIINDFHGVESLEIISPYRVYISIGKVFDDTEIRKNLQDELINFLNEQSKTRGTT